MRFDRDTFLENGTIMHLASGRFLFGYGARTWLRSPSADKPCFYFPDFFLETETPWFTHAYWEEMPTEECYLLFEPQDLTKPDWENVDYSFFAKGFSDLQVSFSQGQMKKAVPFAFEMTKMEMTPQRLQNCLHCLIQHASNYPVHIYGFWDHRSGILGATPEILFQMHFAEKNWLHTHACAGTRARSEISHLFDDKELHEHQLVVQGIEESLSPLGKVEVGELKTLHLSSLSHLMTPIKVELEVAKDFEEIVRRLHPTPALGGFPKRESLEWIRNYQTTVQRTRFGAPVGYIYKHFSSCFVGIRNVQWEGHQMKIGAGCGVVAKSQMNREWNEINIKMQLIKEMLGL